MKRNLRSSSPLLVLLLVVAVFLGACSSGDDSDEGVAPSNDDSSSEEAPADEGDEATETTAAPAGDGEIPEEAIVAAIEAQAESVGVVAVREEGDTRILVMEDGSTAEDLGPACELAQSLVPEGTPISTDLAGDVQPCA
jgi:hypothetical protein